MTIIGRHFGLVASLRDGDRVADTKSRRQMRQAADAIEELLAFVKCQVCECFDEYGNRRKNGGSYLKGRRMAKHLEVPTSDDLDDWREMVYQGDEMVTMRITEFDKLWNAAYLLLRCQDRAKACYVDYDGCTLTKDTWVYIMKGVDPRTNHEFIEDLRKAEHPVCVTDERG